MKDKGKVHTKCSRSISIYTAHCFNLLCERVQESINRMRESRGAFWLAGRLFSNTSPRLVVGRRLAGHIPTPASLGCQPRRTTHLEHRHHHIHLVWRAFQTILIRSNPQDLFSITHPSTSHPIARAERQALRPHSILLDLITACPESQLPAGAPVTHALELSP